MQLFGFIQSTLIFILAFIVLSITGLNKSDCEFPPLKYNDLNDYYIACMSWHDGTGHVILNIDKAGMLTYSLTCADGHAPSDDHITNKTNPHVSGK